MAYTHVDKPIRIGAVTLKNRIVRPAHGTGYGRTGMGEDLIAYHVARANGGAALTVLEVGSVHPSTAYLLNLFDPRLAAGYGALVEQVRPSGMKIFQQLYHGGHHARPPDGSPPWAASDIPSVESGIVPIPMSTAMIAEIVAAYADSARRCAAWGLDGVEIHAANGKLPQQFLSAATNTRTDAYGGSFANRARFVVEVHAAVRAAVPAHFVVGVRLSAELIGKGVDSDENRELAQLLEAQGLVDYVSLSLGNFSTYGKMIGGMQEPMGYQMETSVPVTRAVTVPTMVSGRFRTLEEADQVIRSGDADLVGLVRPLLADPDLVNKSLAGQAHRVRPCIGCNQGCAGNVTMGAAMRCTVNPAVGFETTLSDDRLSPVAQPRRILVIGGGPAGLEAARVAARRGHAVVLAEATARLGGLLNVAAKAPTRASLLDIIGWLEGEVFALGVDVRLNSYVDSGDVAATEVDAVIVATGAHPRLDGIQASHPGQAIRHCERAISSIDLFMAPPASLGRTAVVIDDAGHYEGLAAAEQLIAAGLAVTYVTRQRGIAPLIQSSLMVEPFLQRMAGKPFRYRIRTRVVSLEAGSVVVAPSHLTTDDDLETIPGDTVVLISANRPNRALYDTLRAGNREVRVIGDANSPRYLETAIREGHLAALAL